MFLRFQLANTIYPSYDPVYKEISKSKNSYVGSMKKKRAHGRDVRDKNIIGLYSKCRELTDLLGDLVKLTLLTDTTVLHISTIGVAPFFVESIPELQLAVRLDDQRLHVIPLQLTGREGRPLGKTTSITS